MIIEAREDTVTLRGAISSNIWPAIQAAATLLLENHPTGIIIDCSPLTKITLKGAETFTDASRYIREKNARIVVAGLAPELLEIGKAVPGVRSQLPVCDTVEEARASLSLEEPELKRGRARVAGVVPMIGDWRAALLHARRLAIGENTEIHLVDLIKVPRTLPIGTPLPEREAGGQARLEEARKMLRDSRVTVFCHVERVRAESQGLASFADELKADYMTVSLDRGDKDTPHIDEVEATALLELAKSEVSLIKGAAADRGKPSGAVVIPAVGAWDHAVEHACKLILREPSEVTVVSLITVPRSEPIDTPKPDAEAAASYVAREARRIGKAFNVKVNPVVERVREPILGFTKMIEDGKYGLAVVGVKHEALGEDNVARAIAAALLSDLPCETVFLRTGQ